MTFQKKKIEYSLVDKINLDESYSAIKFYDDCSSLLRKKNNINRTPFFVGGTGLYFRAIEHGLSLVPTISNKIRKKIEFELKVRGLPHLYNQLKK